MSELCLEGYRPDIVWNRHRDHMEAMSVGSEPEVIGYTKKRYPPPASPFDSEEVKAYRRNNAWPVKQAGGRQENLYFLGNFATPTTASPAAVTTGTSACVMLQLAVPTTRQFSIVEYGVSLNGSPAGATLDLRSTSTTAVTTHMTAGTILPYSNVNAPASLASSSDWATAGATNSVAPVATVNQMYDAQLLTTNTYVKQFPLAREPVVGVSGTAYFLNLVLTVPTTSVSALCYFIWRE